MTENPFAQITEKSIMSYGNNFRLKSAFERAKNGDKIKIGYLGGSVTFEWSQGEGYALRSFEDICKKYCPSGAEYINESEIGINSMIELMLIEKTKRYREMDIVFVEFAINDSREPISRDSFESLLRRLLANDKTAVILILVSTKENYSSQPHMSELGKYYGLPIISIQNALQYAISNNIIEWSDYSDDYSHPNAAGHRFISDCIALMLDRISSAPLDACIRLTEKILFKSSFKNLKLLNGWTYSGTPYESMIECRKLIILYRISSDISFGCMEVLIDGETAAVLQGYNSTAWENAMCAELIFDVERREYLKIELKMLEGDEQKQFDIINIGYCF